MTIRLEKYLRYLALGLLFVLLGSALINYQLYRSGKMALSTSRAQHSQYVFSELAKTLTPEVVDKIQGPKSGNGRNYQVMSEMMESARTMSEVTYIYLARYDDASKTWHYILDGHSDSDAVGIQYGEPVEASYLKHYQQAFSSGISIQGIEELSQYGHLTTNYYPLKDISGRVYAVMGLDYDIKAQVLDLKNYLDRSLRLALLMVPTSLIALFAWRLRQSS